MTTINIQESTNPTRFLIISQQKDPETLITTRVLITDNANNRINVVDIGRGPIGPPGPPGIQGPPGQDGSSFSILPINSGGTNNDQFNINKIIYFDGSKLSSTDYSVNDLLNNTNAITGIIAGTGLYNEVDGNNITIHTKLGEGLTTNSSNEIIVDDTIARKFEISLGNISGILPIVKGGTNSSFFSTNRLIYFDGNKMSSFPLETGRIVTSGSTISIVAGSGLVGGGNLSLPSGSVVLNITGSEDIFVSDSQISLSTTGVPGSYTKVITDEKGRVVSGTQISATDVTDILGYVPYHPGNDGSGSLLDAEFLNGKNSDYYLNFNNLTGSISTSILPDIIIPSTFTKVTTNSKGLVIAGTGLNFSDVISGLEYIPLSTSGGTINGNLEIMGNLLSKGEAFFRDNLPLFSFNNESMVPSDPRGFSFEYGSVVKRTGLLAYFPSDQQLKLIVNIMQSGENDIDGGEGSSNFNDDLDGGDASSIFVLGSIVGEESIVLLENIADKKYVNLTENQIISGIKTFTNAITSYNNITIFEGVNYSGPPLIVGSNSGLVFNFNSDLLDGQHGNFYLNANNFSGTIDYNNVILSNLEGTPGSLPLFNNLTDNPSRTLGDSIVKQSGNNLIFIQNGSLSVGSNFVNTSPSLLVGKNNKTLANNSAAIGSDNEITKNNSLAIGSGAKGWIGNQITLGAFVELSGNNAIGRGQTSTAAIGYYGDSGGSYQNLTPFINIPNNRTVSYNIDLLFSKFGSSGLAAISFHSGLVKNTNGNCVVINSGLKIEQYNDSQIRDYIYTAVSEQNNLSKSQILKVTSSPVKNNSATIENLQNINKFRIDNSYMNGSFYKTFDGKIILNLNEPISTGYYTTSSNLRSVSVQLFDNNALTGCVMNFVPLSGINILPNSGFYKIETNTNNYTLTFNEIPWEGTYNNNIVDLTDESISQIDEIGKLNFSGSFNNESSLISNCVPNPSGRLFPGMKIFCGSGFVEDPQIISVFNNSIEINQPYSGGFAQTQNFNIKNYSIFKLSQTSSIYLEGGAYSQPVARTGEIEQTSSGVRIYLSGFTGDSYISPVKISAMFNNSGIAYLTRKRNYNATFGRSTANFKSYNLSFTQQPSSNGSGIISLSGNTLITDYFENYNPYFKFFNPSSSFSGVLSSGSNIITQCVPSQSGKLLAGMILYSSISGFSTTGNPIAVSPIDDTISLTNIYEGVTTSGLIIFSGVIANDNYEVITTSDFGLSIRTSYEPFETGVFLTGTATMFNSTGISNISIQTQELCNLQFGTSGYLQFESTSAGLKPIDDTYLINQTSLGNFSIKNYHLMPDSGVFATGRLILNVNKDHGFLPPASISSLSQNIPLAFYMKSKYQISGTQERNEVLYRLPNSGLFDVISVTGYSITINDRNTNLVTETNKNKILDIFEKGSYEVISNDSGIMSLRYNLKYLNIDDSVYLSFINNNQSYNQNFRITGIRDSGSYGYYDLKSISGTLTGIVPLPNTGLVDYIGSCSGSLERFYNLLYFNYAGDRYEYWKRDSTGKYVDPPITGYFKIYDSPSLCASGTLCIHVSGMSSIQNINKNDSRFFDFLDGSNALDGSYIIKDKIQSNILSFSIPYNSEYIGMSGLVKIIDSVENIKTDRDPNLNNNLLKNTIGISNASNYGGILGKFNKHNNKWKYGVILNKNLNPQRLQPNLSVSNQFATTSRNTNILVFSNTPLNTQIEYSLDNINFFEVEDSTAFDVFSGQTFYLKFIISGGVGKWSPSVDESCPRINILGVFSYNIFTQDRTFNDVSKKWEVVATCSTTNKIISNRNIKIIISDLLNREEKNITFNQKRIIKNTELQTIKPGYVNDITNWQILFEVYGGNLSINNQPFVQIIDGFPNNNEVQISYDYLNYPSGWWGVSLQGLPGSTTGVYNPVVSITENSNSTTSILATGTLVISDTDQDYELSVRTLSDKILIPFSNTNIDDFGFLVPVLTNEAANFSVNFLDSDGLSIVNPNIEYRPILKSFVYRANISGQPGFYQPSLLISVSQPSGASNEQFTKNIFSDIIIYNPQFINLTEYSQNPIINFGENNPWSFSFYIQDGESAFLPTNPPSVFVGNTPSIGTYNTFPLEYNIGKTYDSENARWIVSITGIQDQFGNFASNTGLFNVQIFSEDSSSSNNNSILINIQPDISIDMRDFSYATPNTSYEFPVTIKTPKQNNSFNLEFPSSLKDSLIVLSSKHNKYDPDISAWELYYSGQPLVEKWDAITELNGDLLSVKAKGILNDKIYVAGRVSTIETENEFKLFKPLKIIDLNERLAFDEGQAWKLEFSVEGGLEDPLYPPRITMNGFPIGSQCDGFDPTQSSQPVCFERRTWNNQSKKWIFVFNGVPLCIKNVQFIINILATDVIDEATFGTDSASVIFDYEPIEDHPPPSAPIQFNTELFPNCLPYYGEDNYKINIRSRCPEPTGITGVITWGSLPPGLSFIDTRAGQYSAPWSDLSGGKIIIQGNPTEFASGNNYSQSFNIAVFDARGRSGVLRDLIFKDASVPISPSPTEITIYFSGLDYAYTPSRQLSNTTILGGSQILNEQQDIVRPPASNISMKCLSNLPHNLCLYSTGIYTIIDENNIQLTGPGTSDTISAFKRINSNNFIYVEFDNQLNLSFNKEYLAQRSNNHSVFITISGHNIDESTSGTFELVKTHNNIFRTSISQAGYGGNPVTAPTPESITGIIGAGRYTTQNNTRGFEGRMRPSFSGQIAVKNGTGIYRENFVHHEDLSVFPINGITSQISTIEFTNNCYETGYIRVSGVVLPTPTLEITDPPVFAFELQPYSLFTRIVYGESSAEKNLVANRRNGKNVKGKKYSLQNADHNLDLESISTGPNSNFSFTSPALSSGLVFGLEIKHDSPDKFPTYNKQAIPSLINNYYWIQRAGSENAAVAETTFPPHVPTFEDTFIFTSGDVINQRINFLGGFLPSPGTWSFSDYLPIISGFIQQPIINKKYFGIYNKQFNQTTVNLVIEDNPFVTGDVLKIKAISNSQFNPPPFNFTGVILNNISGNNIIIGGELNPSTASQGTVEIEYAAAISSGQYPHQVLINPGSQYDHYFVNNSIDIFSITNEQLSTQNYFMPNDLRLNIISGDNQYVYAGVDALALSGTLTENSNIITNCTTNPQRIIKPGYILYSEQLDFPQPAIVQSVDSNSITITSAYTGVTTNDVLIIHSGIVISSGYYNYLLTNMSGISSINKNLFNTSFNNFDINFGPVSGGTNLGTTFASITGLSNSFYGNHKFKIITAENTDIPTIVQSGWNNKKFSKTYDMIVNIPLSIIDPASGFSNLDITNNQWTLEFYVTGGFIPKAQSNIIVELDDYIHTFDSSIQYISASGAKISLFSNSAINWSSYFLNNSPSKLFVKDKLGDDTRFITASFE